MSDQENRGTVSVTRIFNAPVELVWKGWTEPEHLNRWWGPRIFTVPVCKIDFREGGTYLYCMKTEEGKEFWVTGTYKEIIPNQKIVFTDSFADADGNKINAQSLGFPDTWPDEMLVTILFEGTDGKTRMTLKHVGVPEGETSDMTSASWNESFDKLVEILK